MGDREANRSNTRIACRTRRSFLLSTASLGAAVSLYGGSVVMGDGTVCPAPWLSGTCTEVVPPPTDTPRHWLGPELWGNRLQDWQTRGTRIECLRGDAGYELRTVAVLSREIVSGNNPAHIRTVTGIAGGVGKDGFAGLLLGVGAGELDYRSAALVGRSSGKGGGLLCSYETDGHVRFREHTNEAKPHAYQILPADDSATTSAIGTPATEDGIELAIDIIPQSDERFTLFVRASAVGTGKPIAHAIRRDVEEESLLGGLALVSSPRPGEDGTRWWFDGLRTAGPKIAVHPGRTFGPIVGTLYSLDGSILKLSAQLFPMAESDPETVRLHYRPVDSAGEWRTQRAKIGDGHVALFRMEGWDSGQAWDYDVEYVDGNGADWHYEGRITTDSGEADDLTIGLLSCTSACARWLDADDPRGNAPGRYTPENIYVPYETLTRNLRAHDPDLLVSVGDQFYERRPTHPDDRKDPDLDLLYKWFLWHWSFRDVARNTPTIVLVDDHDVYQGNLWGSGGDDIVGGAPREGGYVASGEAINRLQRVQTGHNPDPYDSTPIKRGIGVYYGCFTYGGTRFAMLEDRKFKTGPAERIRDDSEGGELLGDRQETFLEDWATDGDAESPTVALTQTIFASALTTPAGNPKVDRDTNGFPPAGRDRAIRLLREAGALVLGGDQHLPTLVRHGIDTPTDGVVQFTGPAGGAFYLRWFRPSASLPNDSGHRYTGEFIDAFGNPLRMLAVANPDVSHEKFAGLDEDPVVFDRSRRSDGYGIVRVDHSNEEYIIECWPRAVNPTDDGATQFPGWPYRLPFGEADGQNR